MSSISYLKAVAHEFRATVTSESENAFCAAIEIIRGGGETETFHLRFVEAGDQIDVFESDPRRLPAACLERHIQSDGSFCLNYADAEPSKVHDLESARRFWSRVDRYLRVQLTAGELRRWPAQSNARAHGLAAEPQARAERIAAQLGDGVLQDLRLGRLSVQRVEKRGKGSRLELWRSGKRIARIDARGSLISTKVPCFCDSTSAVAHPIEVCANHAVLAHDLIKLMQSWKVNHDRYVQLLVEAGYRCCQSLDQCEVRRAIAALETTTHRGKKKS